MDLSILSILGVIATAWFGNLEYRMRRLDERQRQTPTKSEIIIDIDIRLEALKTLQVEIKEDIRDLKRQIERLSRVESARKK